MKIVLTGGGSGGHFYPIVAVAQAIREKFEKEKLLQPELYFLAPEPYDKKMLFDRQVKFKRVPAGKIRIYFSIWNTLDYFKTAIGILKAAWNVFWIYPDVVFSKGGFGSFPAVFVARFLKIPIVIHESDSVPGRVNTWAQKFATKIAVSYPEAGQFFDTSKTAWTGNPVRPEIATPATEGAFEFLGIEKEIPVVLILGGSLGAQVINDAIIEALPELVKKYQIIHQTGKKNIEEVIKDSRLVLTDSPYSNRYKPFDYLNSLSMRMSAGAADIVITRAGSTLFEIALWKKPSIVIPIRESNGDHQRKNAYNYARVGACTVIEEQNLNGPILINEIDRILNNQDIKQKMIDSAESFAQPDAAEKIASVITQIALSHLNEK
jgi:UDP-N-acetylglucosamine--N-acetylmuramyl-(pentapeptide) pyrophosphoryl-undecaprenol N-acetylglucosamine transferase